MLNIYFVCLLSPVSFSILTFHLQAFWLSSFFALFFVIQFLCIVFCYPVSLRCLKGYVYLIWLKNFVVGKEKQGVDAKKTKRLTGVYVLTKKFTSYKIGYKRK